MKRKKLLQAIAWILIVLILLCLLEMFLGIDISKAPRLGD